MTWQAFAVVFAVTGVSVNVPWLHDADGVPLYTLLWSVPIATASGAAAVSTLTRLFGPLFSSKEQEATSRAGLVGLGAVVISSSVTEEFGEVRIRDRSGHQLRVVCRLAPGHPPVPEHANVVIVAHDRAAGTLLVVPIDDPEPPRPLSVRQTT